MAEITKTMRRNAVILRYATAENTRHGVIAASLSGPLDEATFLVLLSAIAHEGPARVVRVERALLLFTCAPDFSRIASDLHGTCLIVRRDQYDQLLAASAALLGKRPIVFLDSQSALAYSWTERWCGLRKTGIL